MKKNVIVTGANRGIGLSIVEAFAKEECDTIWACARKKDSNFEKTLKNLASKTGVSIRPVYFDLSCEEEVKAGIKSIISEKKNIDVLVNNAGIPYGAPFNMTSTDKLREVYQINVISQVLIMQLVSRAMIKQKSGCIVNMCSVGGIETSPGYLAYGSSKAAFIWITKAAAKEFGQFGIRVNGIAPGLVDTQMGNYKSPDELQKVLDRMTIHRMGRPEEIARAVIYVTSDDAAYMTGQILVLDGGRII